jgi:predicted RNA-binding protein with PUA-like domain
MRNWLIKFAPFRVSWQDIVGRGSFKIYGVRNAEARNHLKAMALGDRVMYYHSQTEQVVKGILQVVETAHQDPTTSDKRWVSVAFEPTEALENPVSLENIKKEIDLKEIGLVRQPRLAVMPLSDEAFNRILMLSAKENAIMV